MKAYSFFQHWYPKVKAFVFSFVSGCLRDRITISAGHLAYVTLLSLVPFIMVILTILQAFPAFADARDGLQQMIFSNFLPHTGNVVEKYISQFVANASKMGAVGILSLLVVALMLISNVDKTLNHIWRTPSERQPIFTFAIYWMVLTLGPLLIGTGLAISSYLTGLASLVDGYTPGFSDVLLKAVPLLTSLGAFFLLYMVVPNKRVKARHALGGAFLSALLFELSKKGFALYITNFQSYQVIYGALASVPILLLWIYLSWIVVLLGAEFTVQLEKFSATDEQ